MYAYYTSLLQINTRNNRGKMLLHYINFFTETCLTNSFLQSSKINSSIRLMEAAEDQKTPTDLNRRSFLGFGLVFCGFFCSIHTEK